MTVSSIDVFETSPLGPPSATIAATHGLFLPGAREKLDHSAVQDVWVTDTVSVAAPSAYGPSPLHHAGDLLG